MLESLSKKNRNLETSKEKIYKLNNTTLLNLDMAKDTKNRIEKQEQKIKGNMFNIYNGQKIKNPIISTLL